MRKTKVCQIKTGSRFDAWECPIHSRRVFFLCLAAITYAPIKLIFIVLLHCCLYVYCVCLRIWIPIMVSEFYSNSLAFPPLFVSSNFAYVLYFIYLFCSSSFFHENALLSFTLFKHNHHLFVPIISLFVHLRWNIVSCKCLCCGYFENTKRLHLIPSIQLKGSCLSRFQRLRIVLFW